VKDLQNNSYCGSIEDDKDFHIGKVKMPINSKLPKRMMKIPKVNLNNLSIGTCLSGVPQVDSMPCIHMMVIAKTGELMV
jgi:hypothetical protein